MLASTDSLMGRSRVGDPMAAGARREMAPEEAERFILGLLSDGRKRTTQEVDRASAEAGKRCPDATVRFLSKLRLQGKIEGEFSLPHRTWLWWHPDVAEPVTPAS
ncbi:MAG: hypothetical protein KY455_06775 [Euryarchaeota archaeon]|nr:hypothetical protein [Euryarchaeota archaeon]